MKLLQEPDLQNSVVLVLANKQDLATATSVQDLTLQMGTCIHARACAKSEQILDIKTKMFFVSKIDDNLSQK